MYSSIPSDDIDPAIVSRSEQIQRAAIPSDITDVLGGLVQPEEIEAISAAFRSGCAEQVLGPFLTKIILREWLEMAEIEHLRHIGAVEAGRESDDAISAKELARAIAITRAAIERASKASSTPETSPIDTHKEICHG